MVDGEVHPKGIAARHHTPLHHSKVHLTTRGGMAHEEQNDPVAVYLAQSSSKSHTTCQPREPH